jgi:hypothetical protein
LIPNKLMMSSPGSNFALVITGERGRACKLTTTTTTMLAFPSCAAAKVTSMTSMTSIVFRPIPRQHLNVRTFTASRTFFRPSIHLERKSIARSPQPRPFASRPLSFPDSNPYRRFDVSSIDKKYFSNMSANDNKKDSKAQREIKEKCFIVGELLVPFFSLAMFGRDARVSQIELGISIRSMRLMFNVRPLILWFLMMLC